MKFKSLTLLSTIGWLILAGGICFAQESAKPRVIYGDSSMVPKGNSLDNPDWTEEKVPPPPAFSNDRLIQLDMPSYVSVRVGVDPETIVVGRDGVVRYVIVMRNTTGNTSAVYEGIRCFSNEVKTYARKSGSGDWSYVQTPAWIWLADNMPSHHAQVFAHQGGCVDRQATSKQEIIAALKLRSVPLRGLQSE